MCSVCKGAFPLTRKNQSKPEGVIAECNKKFRVIEKLRLETGNFSLTFLIFPSI